MRDGSITHAAMAAAIRAELQPFFADLQRFIDRRIAELSAEVHGATQLLGFSEDNLSSQLGHLHQDLARMLTAPGAARRPGGRELEAVVQTTEAAANQIMEAAESINATVRRTLPDPSALAAISSKIDAIFEACAFQDLTGQRVRRAIEHLHQVDTTLTGLGVLPANPGQAAAAPSPTGDRQDASQRDIDALFD
jgi:chemotaxis protein CheZ